MKKFIFFTIIMLYAISLMAQHVKLSDTVEVDIPVGAKKLNRDQFTSAIRNKFSSSKMAYNTTPDPAVRTDNKHFYMVDNVLIRLVHGTRPVPVRNDYLVETKKGLDAMHIRFNKDSSHYTSIIKTINNYQILITYDDYENIGYYSFFCDDTSNRFALNGSLQFYLVDKNKATVILNDLIKSIQFSNYRR